jgi:hypothetical protein
VGRKEKMKNNLKNWGVINLLAAALLFIIVIVGGSLLGGYVKNRQANQSVNGIEVQSTPVTQQTIAYNGQDGKNALDLLKASHKVETEDSSTGSFVTSIDGTVNTDNTYWMFYVNGQLASTGADQFVTKNGDKIEWRFQTFQ